MRNQLWCWIGAIGLFGFVCAGTTARADSPSPFDELRELDRRIDHHRMASRRLSREIERWDRTFEESLREGQLAERAVGRLQRKVADRLVSWEKVHRDIERHQYRWGPKESSDLRQLLRQPEVETLRQHREMFEAIGRLRGGSIEPAVLMGERASLSIELAQHRASEEAAREERDEVVEQSQSEQRDEEIEAAMQRAQQRLEDSLEQSIEYQTGADFHRRKGTLLSPIPDEPDVMFGRRKQSESVSYVRHTGLTYKVDRGTSVRSVADGLVVFAKRFEGYGKLVIIDHGDGYHSLYAHLDDLSVAVGDELERGSNIGASGATGSFEGPKLYFELRQRDKPVDPSPWFVRQQSE